MFAHAVRIVAACCLAVTACSGPVRMGPGGLQVRMTANELQQMLDRVAGFPVRRSLDGLGSVRIQSAQLVLLPDDNAIGLSMPVDVGTMGRSWSGTVALSAVPGYDRKTGTIYLHDFVVREVQAAGLPRQLAGLSAGVITEVLRDSVQRYDVHTLDPDRRDEKAARMLLKEIEVQRDAVVFRLGL